ncbi:MAG: FtsX-like permease family protein [Lachnospiraceae bacterium]|nr:FtsX-like permease family protein [Lachnospiraceae bacterium]
MLENDNLKICRKLVRREFQFHKGRSILLMTAIALVSMLCTFSFALGFVIRDGYLYGYQVRYGSTSHILYYGLNSVQAASIANHADVKKAVLVRAIGNLSDDVMEYRSVKLAAVDSDWATTTEAVPVFGRMPESDDEIALDELTMRSLAIPHKEGAEVVLRWIPVDGGEERVSTFRLCGWWSSDMSSTETCAWITQETAERLYPDAPDLVTMGVTLYRPEDLDMQAEKLLADLGVDGVVYATNLAYNGARVERADGKAVPYYMINIAVAACGMLMVYSIVRLSAGENVRFYGRVKSLGMSPRQIGRLLSGQAVYLCLPAIPVGWLLGFTLCAVVAPYVILNMGGQNPALLFFRVAPFVYSALFTYFITLTACMLPAKFVSKISPAEAVRFVGTVPRRSVLPFMRLSGIGRDKGKSALAAASMLLSLTLLCVLWTQYVSADEDKYLEDIAYSDYLIADASATTNLQRYNPWSRSITPEFLAVLAGHEAVTELGTIRTMEVPMYASEEERAIIVENFESRDSDGVVRKENMAGSPDWLAGYEIFRETGEYIGIATGIDGLALSVALLEGEYVEGSYDADRFATGDYVIAAGASATSFVSTPPVGSRVEIGGRSFEIMAAVSYKSHMITGSDSRKAEYNISYYMPVRTYEELFHDSGVRNILVDIDSYSQERFEVFLRELIGDTGIGVTMRSDNQWEFKNALFHTYMIPMFVGAVLLLIGVLNFGNALVTSVLVRKKEFAVYESLGMTQRQIRRLLIYEGLTYGGVLTAFLVPVVSVLTWLLGRWWITHTASAWCATWRYSLMPMWIVLPFLFAAALLVPLCCLRLVMRESVTERLRVAE